MPWEVEYTDEFGQWGHKLSEGQLLLVYDYVTC